MFRQGAIGIYRARVNTEARRLVGNIETPAVSRTIGGAWGQAKLPQTQRSEGGTPPDRRARHFKSFRLTLGLTIKYVEADERQVDFTSNRKSMQRRILPIQCCQAPRGRLPRAGGRFYSTVSLIAQRILFLRTPSQSKPPQVELHRQLQRSRGWSPRRRSRRTGSQLHQHKQYL